MLVCTDTLFPWNIKIWRRRRFSRCCVVRSWWWISPIRWLPPSLPPVLAGCLDSYAALFTPRTIPSSQSGKLSSWAITIFFDHLMWPGLQGRAIIISHTLAEHQTKRLEGPIFSGLCHVRPGSAGLGLHKFSASLLPVCPGENGRSDPLGRGGGGWRVEWTALAGGKLFLP